MDKSLFRDFINWCFPKNRNFGMNSYQKNPHSEELFSDEQLERYGANLAETHTLHKHVTSGILLQRLAWCEATLNKNVAILAEASNLDQHITPAGDWLLDNFYLIEEQIYIIRRHIPKDYEKDLPHLQSENDKEAYPRVYDIALEIIAHSDGRWDLQNLSRFIHSYQSVTPLTLGELWAFPVMLRLAIIENLSLISTKIANNRHGRNLADYWADLMVEVAATEPKKLVLMIADMVRAEPPMTMDFVAEFTRRLQSAELALPLNWIEQKLAEEGLTIEQLVLEENTQQAANQVTVSNCINSLRRLSEVDWHDFVEQMSVVEKYLCEDPSGIYPQMDFSTRDSYRHIIERLAKASKKSQFVVAESVIKLASTVSPIENSLSNLKQRHVGYYLIGDGVQQLKNDLGIKRTFLNKISNWIASNKLFCYLGTLGLIVFSLTFYLLHQASVNGISTTWLILLAIVVSICISEISLFVLNLLSMICVGPISLPKMDFSKAIPETSRTLVVVPALLRNIGEVESLIEALEIRFLGNRDKNLYFALLTDFQDSSQEHNLEDKILINHAVNLITALNKQYQRDDKTIFYLLHRSKLWNAKENVWMGHERKRGKLEDLNNLICNKDASRFSVIVGDVALLYDTKYIITLDTDTQLPRETAAELIGAMAHPLNQPELDKNGLLISAGYGVLQPRISETLSNVGLTRYLGLYSNDTGLDPYTRTVSNLYQDIFKEGSYVGKGIYDTQAFQKVLAGRFPENLILSHDLLEGCYLRSGFLSDVVLYESSPSDYLTDVKRRFRWIRGDWQLIAWLFPRVPDGSGGYNTNPLSALAKWKIFDNLRRSLVSLSLMILFLLNLTVLRSTYFWFVFITLVLILPSVMTIVFDVFHFKNMMFRQYISNLIQQTQHKLNQLFFYIVCLPFEAWYSSKAILITLWRISFSKKHLLEWTPSEQINLYPRSISFWLRKMWIGPVAAILFVLLILHNQNHLSLILASPLLFLWFISPLYARWMSKPLPDFETKLDQNSLQFLHILSRKTWSFFETFLTDEDNWLPPDNFQEEPVTLLAHRTSPTNMGLALLANLSAYDYGYITTKQLLFRITKTFKTMESLQKYRGHFYNWYDTQTLEPLHPRYVSTVDDGNLAGHLLTLRQGLLLLKDDPILRINYLDGLQDTLDVLTQYVSKQHLDIIKRFKDTLKSARSKFNNWSDALNICNELYDRAKQTANIWIHHKIDYKDQYEWSQKLLLQCRQLLDEIKLFSQSAVKLDKDINLNSLNTDEAQSRIKVIDALAYQAFQLSQMDVGFLYNEKSRLLTIGYNVDNQLPDRSHYDLLSSEARLANYVAIAQGQLPQESWFALGRLQVMGKRGQPYMMSWSGSMFEYLMPLLVMPSYHGTLIDQMHKSAVNRQIAYGKQSGVPWGFSESGYYAWDANFNYLYRAFGVPELGFKRGLGEELVVAPYATVMALMVAPEEASRNLKRLADLGAMGDYGFYEAIDYTTSRLPVSKNSMIIRSFMAHHQGMSLLALSYLLHNQPMQKRFAADPLFQSALLLLQERTPKANASYYHTPTTHNVTQTIAKNPETTMRIFTNPDMRMPQIQLLSNGRYHVMLTHAGSGYTRWKNLAVTRWREDAFMDNRGMFSYIRDIGTGKYWSIAYQPTTEPVEFYKAIFSEAHVEFNCNNADINTYTEIVISPEDDIELRRSRIQNISRITRTIEFTTYAEVVLTTQNDDLSQAAFSNLFVETELHAEQGAILVTRRGRDNEDDEPWMLHMLNVYSDKATTLSYETNRTNFVGRCGNTAKPLAMLSSGPLSNTAGIVLDPIVAIRCRVSIPPGSSVVIDLINGVTETRDHSLALIEKYKDRQFANRIFELSWTHSQVLLHQLNITEAETKVYEKLATAIIFAGPTFRPDDAILINNWNGQSKLWAYSISGDLPIVLLTISDVKNIEIVHQLVQAQAYWRRKGLIVDLFIINEEETSYRGVLQDQIMSLINTMLATEHMGGIFLRVADQIPAEDYQLLQAAARVVLSDKRGSLKEQVMRRHLIPITMKTLLPQPAFFETVIKKIAPLPELVFFNGLGGFTTDGKEYVIALQDGMVTPAPWINVLANPNFGTFVSESGQACTWIENSHEFRLTPWDNDPVEDQGGENFYIRDDVTGRFWSPTVLPCRGVGEYRIRHGFGYSVFEHIEDGIHTELQMHVATDTAVKYMVLKITNYSKRPRKISVFGYAEWILGDLRSKNAMHIITENTENGAILAQNHYNTDFAKRTAFFQATTATGITDRTITGSRAEFIGRNRSNQNPKALEKVRLSGKVGPALDPCAAIHLSFDLSDGYSREIIFTLGAGIDKEHALALIDKFQDNKSAITTLNNVKDFWQKTLKQTELKTLSPEINFLANGWLLYQVISSRLWGRTAFYQSSGAFGFRDQLQDVMALVHTLPNLFRDQLLLCASRQFLEGDVQHWWHPPSGRGVRTRCSDDFLWLPFALCRYLETTGDTTVLDEEIHFIEGRLLKPDEVSNYDLPTISNEKASLYEHCIRSIKHGLNFGIHGLPLIGSCDWNDGMDKVGVKGRGESIWLGFFLYIILERFANVALARGDNSFADICTKEHNKLRLNLEEHAWDGDWYLRAYFDDGTPLGSKNNTECRIDSIAQSWAVLSKAAPQDRAVMAMKSLNQYLVRRKDKLITLLDPPFNISKPDPGYIESYVPGIRENGGQYTHASVWAIMAFVELKEIDLAWQLFNMINPINHGSTAEEIKIYKIEPYVLAGDVYSVSPHNGRGGWSWYTGSAGWMYQLLVESLLGIHLQSSNKLILKPHLPADWDTFQYNYRYKQTEYNIKVQRGSNAEITLDGIKLAENIIPLVDDQKTHEISLVVTPIIE